MLRNVFVIGDSISIQYGTYLKERLEGKFSYDRKRGEAEALKDLNLPLGGNGGDSSRVLAYMTEQNESKVKYDILLVNCGLHDIKTDPVTGTIQITADEYERNLKEICALGKSMANQFIWIRTTSLDDHIHNTRSKSFHRFHQDVVQYNAIADRIMQQNAVTSFDLYTFTLGLGTDVYCDHVHFTDDVRKAQAAFISQELEIIS